MLRQGLGALVLLLVCAAPASAATITVTTTADDGPGSLRAALATANAAGSATTVVVPAGRYVVGDQLEVTGTDVTVRGAGARTTVLDGGDEGRVLAVPPGASAVVEDLAITRGAESGATGGGIASAGTLVLRRTAVLDNFAGAPGGGVFNSGVLRVERSTIAGNTGDDGGGIHNRGTLDVVASTIAGNRTIGTPSPGNPTPARGGGLYHDTGATTRIVSTTVADNRAGYGLGGNVAGDAGTVQASSSLVVGGVPDDCASTTLTALSTVFTTSAGCGGGTALASFALGALADNGGPTDTLALAAPSPAIDAGTCDGGTDQRGRPQAGAACDVGAYELQPVRTTQLLPAPVAPTVVPVPVPVPAPAPAAASSPAVVAPLRSLRLRPARFRVARGTGVTVTAARAGRVRFTVQRLTPGRRVANRCVRAVGTNRARAGCTRRVAVTGSFVRDVRAGANRFAWKGRLGVRALRPGRYELVAVVLDGTRRSTSRRASFTVTIH